MSPISGMLSHRGYYFVPLPNKDKNLWTVRWNKSKTNLDAGRMNDWCGPREALDPQGPGFPKKMTIKHTHPGNSKTISGSKISIITRGKFSEDLWNRRAQSSTFPKMTRFSNKEEHKIYSKTHRDFSELSENKCNLPTKYSNTAVRLSSSKATTETAYEGEACEKRGGKCFQSVTLQTANSPTCGLHPISWGMMAAKISRSSRVWTFPPPPFDGTVWGRLWM